MRWSVPTFLVIVVALFLGSLLVHRVDAKKKPCLLHAMQAILVENDVEQPSGLTFSHRTKKLYMICDTGHCNYVFEFNEDGEYLRKLEFTKDHKDVEAVACNDAEGLLYIAEESKRMVTAYYMPEDEIGINMHARDLYPFPESDAGIGAMPGSHVHLQDIRSAQESESTTIELEEALHFTVEAPAESTPNNGIEGLTVNDRTGEIFCTNEKNPREIIHLSALGEPIDIRYPQYAEDLSGLCYDNELNLLWVLSDKSEALYVTDVDTGAVYDYWDLDMENPEGVALNNDHDPPLLYISTDPSSPQGAQYVAALFIFVKPEIGSGRGYNDQCSFEDNCIGCDAIKTEAKVNQKAFDEEQEALAREIKKKDRNEGLGLILGLLLPILTLLIVIILIVVVFLLVWKREQLKRLARFLKQRGGSGDDGISAFEMDDDIDAVLDVEDNVGEGQEEELAHSDEESSWLGESPVPLFSSPDEEIDLLQQPQFDMKDQELGERELYA